MPWKCFRCGSEDHLLTKCPNPPKNNEKWIKQVCFNKKGNCACDNGENKNHKIADQTTADQKRPDQKISDQIRTDQMGPDQTPLIR